MKQYRFLAAIGLSLWTILPARAEACSVVSDYRVPTNLELVDQSPLILRGRVIGERKGRSTWETNLLVEPIEALKGDLPSGTITIIGSSLVPKDEARGFSILSNPYELEGAHPLSYIGGCIRYMFPNATTPLFFLKQEGDAWRAAGGPFSRWAEDVIAEDAPWTVLTRFYIKVLEADPADRQSMLEAERDRFLAREGDPVAALMARDVERQLAGPNEAWNTVMQQAIDTDGNYPAGAEAEVLADAIANIMTESGDDYLVAEAVDAVFCERMADGQSLNCDGVRYSRDDASAETMLNRNEGLAN